MDIPYLEIKKGYITGFVGENGAGKTTTIKLMLDMLIPDSGSIEIDGVNVRNSGAEVKKYIGYVGDPTSGLDPVVRQDILDVLMEHMQDEEVSVFYSTHITSDLERAGDYLVYIKNGKICMNAPLDELQQQYCLVSGAKELFTKEIQKELVGYKASPFGGMALVKSRKLAEELFGREAQYSTPNIEDMMIFLSSKGGEN